MKLRSLVVATAILSGASACKHSIVGCPAINTPAIRLLVRDAQTGSLAASGVTLIATRSGGMADTVNLPSGSNFDPYPIPIGASPGTYALLLKKSGYADWTKGGVEVPLDHAGGCQPGTVSLEALIQELP